MSTEYEDRGYELGLTAFVAGLPAIPMRDPALVEELKGSAHILELLSGWTQGWHRANARATVKLKVAED